MSDFNPGDGWREVPYGTPPKEPGWLMECLPDGTERYWVRVDPLPTEPYTVIRVTWKTTGDKAGFTLKQDGTWRGVNTDITAEDLATSITSFKVLAEPRAVTAKALLDRVREHEGEALSTFRMSLDRIARDFE